VPVAVTGTGVAVRLATHDEARAVESARRGREVELEPPRSYMFTVPDRPLADDEVYVVAEAFVEFSEDGKADRWTSYEHHGHVVPLDRDATLELLRAVDEASGDLIELLSDMRIADMAVSRWQIMSAPRRIELEPELERRIAPLRRG